MLIGAAGLLVPYLVLVWAGGGLRPRFDDTFAGAGEAMVLFAHRGVDLTVPENSEASLSEARRVGFRAVEIDVRKTKSGELVLFHDKTGRRRLGLNEPFHELTWERIQGRKLLFDGRETTNSVPALREVFQKFGPTLWFYLDMKDKQFEDADQIVALIREFGLLDRTILASVDPSFVAYVEHKHPSVNTALERFDYFQTWLYRLIPTRWKPDYLAGFAHKVTPGHVEWLKEKQLLAKRIVYEVDATNYHRMLNLGVTKAIIDYDPALHAGALAPNGSAASAGSGENRVAPTNAEGGDRPGGVRSP